MWSQAVEVFNPYEAIKTNVEKEDKKVFASSLRQQFKDKLQNRKHKKKT
jgi:hypothetical protein